MRRRCTATPFNYPEGVGGGDVATTGGRSHHQALVLHRDVLKKGRRKVRD
ncbi:hypothetical protein A2U01_0026459 [Trifolium medium]|uniref:Uncharacterized protein n=1 Tax=Trifolium medium TaxID=97028 RepID=A0A392P227_9FABA|nr:hypothetical protein [Trifolium medium]